MGAQLLNHALIGLSFRYQFTRRETDAAFNFSSVLNRRPYTEEDALS
jgi:hypothetical protein